MLTTLRQDAEQLPAASGRVQQTRKLGVSRAALSDHLVQKVTLRHQLLLKAISS
jgi:hypothetical protein